MNSHDLSHTFNHYIYTFLPFVWGKLWADLALKFRLGEGGLQVCALFRWSVRVWGLNFSVEVSCLRSEISVGVCSWVAGWKFEDEGRINNYKFQGLICLFLLCILAGWGGVLDWNFRWKGGAIVWSISVVKVQVEVELKAATGAGWSGVKDNCKYVKNCRSILEVDN